MFIKALILFTILLWRWVSYPTGLPQGWKQGNEIQITAKILEVPEHTDTKTVIRLDRFYIRLQGYQQFELGEMVSITGKIEPQVLLGKNVRIVMDNPVIVYEKSSRETDHNFGEQVKIFLVKLRARWVEGVLARNLPEPHASLAAGILLGVKRGMPTDFYNALVATGTLHVVAASGYNVAIVAQTVMGLLLTISSRGLAIIIALAFIALYVVISGGSASVIRAGIMGSLTLLSYYFGRPTEARRLLWITVYLMLLISPLMLVDVGFQLSVTATIGLLYLEPIIKRKMQSSEHSLKQSSELKYNIQIYLAEYLYPTLAATIMTLPVILWWFGRIAWISPIVNMLILPLVPLIMFLTAIVIMSGSVWGGLGWVMSLVLFVPLYVMVEVIRLFGR